jgi:hypothetical protein
LQIPVLYVTMGRGFPFSFGKEFSAEKREKYQDGADWPQVNRRYPKGLTDGPVVDSGR